MHCLNVTSLAKAVLRTLNKESTDGIDYFFASSAESVGSMLPFYAPNP